MRVLVVTTWFPDRSHPSRTPFCLEHTLAIALTSSVEVVHIDLSARGVPWRETFQGLTVHRVPHNPRSPLSWWRLTRMLRSRLAAADILHTMAFSTVFMVASAWLTRRLPWLHTEHWTGIIRPVRVAGTRRIGALLRHVLKLPHATTAVSTTLADAMAPFTRAPGPRVIPPVVTGQSPVPYPPEVPLVLVGVGLLIDRKDPMLALEAVGMLRDEGVELRYVWLGDGPLRTELEAQVALLGLQEVVTFVGTVDPAAVHDRLAEAHAFFVPSRQETFFVAAAEAILCGRPAVLPPCGGLVDDHCTDENSVIAVDWRPESLAEAIRTARRRFHGTSPVAVAATLGDRFTHASVGAHFQDAYMATIARAGR